MELMIVETADNRNEISGTTKFNDGTKAYWTEGAGDLMLIAPDGTRTEISNVDPEIMNNPYGAILMGDGTDYKHRVATREEEVEYEMIAGNMSAEQAEANVAEMDSWMNEVE